MESTKQIRTSSHEEQTEAKGLTDLCESAYSSFCSSGGGSTLDTHLDNCLQHVADEDAKCFVWQVSTASYTPQPNTAVRPDGSRLSTLCCCTAVYCCVMLL
jgi:hypothetical protein